MTGDTVPSSIVDPQTERLSGPFDSLIGLGKERLESNGHPETGAEGSQVNTVVLHWKVTLEACSLDKTGGTLVQDFAQLQIISIIKMD